jgi:methionine-rich copper-binding protein CopC
MLITTTIQKIFWNAILCVVGLLVSCVAVQTPEGGPPDETPPMLIRTVPENGSLNFKGKKIILTFDKDIAVENIYSKLRVMPQLEKPKKQQAYRYEVRGRTLKIMLNAPLKEDTTYSMHFNDVVKDTHEGTKATNAVLTFSTGSFIDPITAKGRIKDLLTNKPVGDVHVCLYNAERDPKEWNNKGKGEPDYYTTSDKEGNFSIERIRLGRYYIRAMTGKTHTGEIDYEKERYGFLRDLIDLTESREDIVVPLVAADVRDFKLLRVVPQKGFCAIVLNKTVKTYAAAPLQVVGTNMQLYSFVDPTSPKTVLVYNTLGMLEGDDFELKLTAEDALHVLLEEHVTIRFKEGKQDIKRLTHSLKSRPISSIIPRFRETISFNKPITKVVASLVYFEGKHQEKIGLAKEELRWNATKTQLTIKKNFSEEELKKFTTTKKEGKGTHTTMQRSIALKMDAGACIAFDQEQNKPIDSSYVLREEAETGTIAGTIETEHGCFRIELLNENDEVVDSIRNQKNYQFKMVPPGTYAIRILVLQEGKKEWSPGNIRNNLEPDPVFFYDKPISVVEAWDITGIDFKF